MNQFTTFCFEGDLECAKEQFNLGGIHIHDDDDYAFRISCYNNHLEVAKWLYSISNINIQILNDVFESCCYSGCLDICQWLYSLNKIIINDKLFIKWLYGGHLIIIKWLYSISHINVDIISDAIKICIYYRHNDLLNWLYTIKTKKSLLMNKLDNLDNLKLLYQINNNNEDCIICLSKEQYMIQLDCKHIYCCACLKQYLELEKTKCCYCSIAIDMQSDRHIIYKCD